MGTTNGPLSVSAPGTDIRVASGVDVIFNTRYPFAKIDSTINTSFQVLTLYFTKDTPNPNGTTVKYNRTLIYQFAHSYTYTPASWFLVSLDNFTTAYGPEGAILVSNSLIPYSQAILVITVDNTNINFYVDKYYDATAPGPPSVPSVLGLFVAIRSYVFVNDLAGTDVPSQA